MRNTVKKTISRIVNHNNTRIQKMVQNISFPTEWPCGAHGVGCRWAHRVLCALVLPSLLPQVTCSARPRCPPRGSPAVPDTEKAMGPRGSQRAAAAPSHSHCPGCSQKEILGSSSEQCISKTNRHPLCPCGQPLTAELQERTAKVSTKGLPPRG